jgi:nitrile hydratase
MNGVHDMGGMHGFGPVLREDPEVHFHAPWERQALGLTLAAGALGQWNIDQSRAARESLPPAVYLGSGYYRIWILALERLLLQRGLIRAEELAALGHPGVVAPLPSGGQGPADPRSPQPEGRGAPAADALGNDRDRRPTAPLLPAPRALGEDRVDAALAKGTSAERGATQPAGFAVGQRVRARKMHPAGHTRLPRYVRGQVGTVVRVHGVQVFADRHAATPPGRVFDEAAQWLYAVEFEGRDLWGDEAEPGLRVSVDAWESYLEAVL